MVNESEPPLPADFGAEEGVFPGKRLRIFTLRKGAENSLLLCAGVFT